MAMSKKDFIALGDAMRQTMPDTHVPNQTPTQYQEAYAMWALCVITVADACRAMNPRFDRSRWLGYVRGECGPSGGKVDDAKKPAFEYELQGNYGSSWETLVTEETRTEARVRRREYLENEAPGTNYRYRIVRKKAEKV